MKFCSACSAPIALRIPPGDSLPRHVCDSCGAIHYRNPRMVVGALPVWGDSILLCRRAIEPRYGKWTLPAGFMENGESLAEAAVRETLEEAQARIDLEDIFTLVSVPHINQVHIVFRARLRDLHFSAGQETLELRLFSEADIPWKELAFRSISITLRHFFADRQRGAFTVHNESIDAPLSPPDRT